MRGLCFICNTPSAAMASSVLHRTVESATRSGHPAKRPIADVRRRALPRQMNVSIAMKARIAADGRPDPCISPVSTQPRWGSATKFPTRSRTTITAPTAVRYSAAQCRDCAPDCIGVGFSAGVTGPPGLSLQDGASSNPVEVARARALSTPKRTSAHAAPFGRATFVILRLEVLCSIR